MKDTFTNGMTWCLGRLEWGDMTQIGVNYKVNYTLFVTYNSLSQAVNGIYIMHKRNRPECLNYEFEPYRSFEYPQASLIAPENFNVVFVS